MSPSRASHTQPLTRLYSLDVLRWIAVCMVIFHHMCNPSFPLLFHHIPKILSLSYTGVDLFFVISGFVVTKSFLTLLDHKKNSAHALKTFVLRRILRILPLSLLWILLIAFSYFSTDIFPFSEAHLWQSIEAIVTLRYNYYATLNLDMLRNAFVFAPYWSLMVEEHFYLGLPSFLILVRSRNSRIMALIAIVLLVTFYLRPTTSSLVHPITLLYSTHLRLDILAAGSLLAIGCEYIRAFSDFKQTKQILTINPAISKPTSSGQFWAATSPSSFKNSRCSLATTAIFKLRRLVSHQTILRICRFTNGRVNILFVTFFIITLSIAPAIIEQRNVRYPLLTFISTLVVYLALKIPNKFITQYRILRIFSALGVRSYGYYLAHMPLMYWISAIIEKYNLSLPAALAIYSLTLLIVCEFLHRFFEKPFIQYAHKFGSPDLRTQ